MKPDNDEPYDGPTRPVVRRAVVVDAPTAPEPNASRTPAYGTPAGSEGAPAYGTPPREVGKPPAAKGRKQAAGKPKGKAPQKATPPATPAPSSKRRPSPPASVRSSPAPRRKAKPHNARAKRKSARAKAQSAAAIAARVSHLGRLSLLLGAAAGVLAFSEPESGAAAIALAAVGIVLGGVVLIRRRTSRAAASVGIALSIFAITSAGVIMGVTAHEEHESELRRQLAEEQIPVVTPGQPVAAPDAVACVADGRLALGAPGILTLDGEPQWQVTVDQVTLDASEQILAFDETNVPAGPPLDYAMATVTLTYLGDDGDARPGGLVAAVDGVDGVHRQRGGARPGYRRPLRHHPCRGCRRPR